MIFQCVPLDRPGDGGRWGAQVVGFKRLMATKSKGSQKVCNTVKQKAMTWSYLVYRYQKIGKLNEWIMLWTWNYLAFSILLLRKQDDVDHLDSRWWFCNLNTESTEVIPCEVWTTELLYGQRRDSAGATVKGTFKWLLKHQQPEW